MVLPALRKCIYGFCMHDNASMEALMNVMQATFLVLQSIPTLDDDILSKAYQVFCYLYAQYFEKVIYNQVKTKFSVFLQNRNLLSCQVVIFSSKFVLVSLE